MWDRLKPTGATTSLTVSDNAIVRAENGIKASRVDEPTPSGTGIVFDGTEGTVYGEVELQEDLTIGAGESLTLAENASLNANGCSVIVDGGTVDESIKNALGGSVKYPPRPFRPRACRAARWAQLTARPLRRTVLRRLRGALPTAPCRKA